MNKYYRAFSWILIILLGSTALPRTALATEAQCPSFLNKQYHMLHSKKKINLCELYTGKPLLIVNTASHCGYTSQFKGLEALYQKYKKDGVQLVGFTSNDFMQAAKSEEEAASICYRKYGVSFTMLSLTRVKGRKANQTFEHLSSVSSPPKWNFNKYLITGKDLKVTRFDSDITPTDSILEKAIIKALKHP